MRFRARRARSEEGFTILTALIAVVLLSVAVVALSGTTVYMLSLKTEANVRSTAAGIATAYMEEVKIRNPSTLASESVLSVNELGDLSGAGPYTRELKVESGPAVNSKLVTITVMYPRGRATMGRVELVTIIYEGVAE